MALAVLGFLVVASGTYNVAASKRHFGITRALLEFALHRSVATHSWFAPSPPDLDDPDRARLGAGHFVRGCAICHGAPGQPRNVAADHMLPTPPSLSLTVDKWTDKELFWIVQNGFKYTGMPAWPAPEREDEIWAVVAFLRQLPGISAEGYRRLTSAPPQAARAPGGKANNSELIAECSRCHGDEDAPPASRLVPKLTGQKEAYLAHALADYAEGRRPSGIMELLAVPLGLNAQAKLAAYYASLPADSSKPQRASREEIERGRQIATRGLPADGVPACIACHSSESAETFPQLAGQHGPYLVQQFKLFRQGLRAGTPQGAIMTAVAKRLDDEEIAAVAAYFEDVGRNVAEGAKR
jgi:cytochrome c553